MYIRTSTCHVIKQIFTKCCIFSKFATKCVFISEFPSCWKVASVVPIPQKASDLSQPSSYRPISLLPIAGKIFEVLINKGAHWLSWLSASSIWQMQYGFCHSRSIGDLLFYLTEHVSRVLNSQGESRSVALDISKAFDKVWHQGLLHKLLSYGTLVHFTNFLPAFLRIDR